MKSLLLVLFVMTFLGCANEVIKWNETYYKDKLCYKVNETEPFTGTVITKYDNGQVRFKGYYKNGKPIKTTKRWWKNGVLKFESKNNDKGEEEFSALYYQDGKKKYYSNVCKSTNYTGSMIGWYPNGKKNYEKHYKDREIKEKNL